MAERDHDDEWLSSRLKAEADRYEPDLARIRERIQNQRSDRPARRSTWLLPAAAATFVVLTAGAITALYSQGSPGSDQVQVIGPAGSQSSLPTDVPTTRSSVVITEVPQSTTKPARPSDTGSSQPGASRTTQPAPPAATGAGSQPVLDVQVAAATDGQKVTLPGGATDWIAAGSGAAGQTVRRANGEQTISGPHETGSPVSVTQDGPFSLSWTGGLAQESTSGSRVWRTVSGPQDGPDTGLIFRAPAQRRTSTFVLYIGAQDATAELRTKLGDQSKVTRLKATSGGYVATVRFHNQGQNEELTVELIGGSGGSISFAAASLR